MVMIECNFCGKTVLAIEVSEFGHEHIHHKKMFDKYIDHARLINEGFLHICDACAAKSKQDGIMAIIVPLPLTTPENDPPEVAHEEITFIDLYSDKGLRGSSLQVESDFLRVLGVLPHGYEVRPKTIADALRLIHWLESWVKTQK